MEKMESRLYDYFWIFKSNLKFQDLIDMTLRKMDNDRDGQISFSDFRLAVEKEPLMMEAFGPCLPNNRAGGNFIKKILETKPNGILYYV